MYEYISLDKVDVGNKCIVKDILFKNNLKTRIFDLGIIENTVIEVLYKSPFNDPVAYFVRGTVIAIRNDDAKNIIVMEDINE